MKYYVGPALCRTCREPLVTEIPATGDGQCIDCWLKETDALTKTEETDALTKTEETDALTKTEETKHQEPR